MVPESVWPPGPSRGPHLRSEGTLGLLSYSKPLALQKARLLTPLSRPKLVTSTCMMVLFGYLYNRIYAQKNYPALFSCYQQTGPAQFGQNHPPSSFSPHQAILATKQSWVDFFSADAPFLVVVLFFLSFLSPPKLLRNENENNIKKSSAELLKVVRNTNPNPR